MSWKLEKYYSIINCDKELYDILVSSDNFFELYPDMTGEYEEDIQIARYKINCLLAQDRGCN